MHSIKNCFGISSEIQVPQENKRLLPKKKRKKKEDEEEEERRLQTQTLNQQLKHQIEEDPSRVKEITQDTPQ